MFTVFISCALPCASIASFQASSHCRVPTLWYHSLLPTFLDGLAAYICLVETLNFSLANIFLYGDSAGGNLVLALTRYLHNAPASGLESTLPSPPSAILLQSPWTDPSSTHIPSGPGPPSSSTIINVKTDTLDRSPRSPATIGYIGLKGKHMSDKEARTNILISPGSLDIPNNGDGLFKRYPRTHVLVGG